jgi:hypothetical protein
LLNWSTTIDGTIFGEDGEGITFSVDGVDCEIDLKHKHASKIHKRSDSSSSTPPGSVAAERRSHRPVVADAPVGRCGNVKEIHVWAAKQGYEISLRGRIPTEIEQAFQDAH